MAPALGLEPRTKWLTATYSTIELRRSIMFIIYHLFLYLSSSKNEKKYFFTKKVTGYCK